MTELVVLVDNQNNQIGVQEKDSVHTRMTLLHRGFSVFLFNSKKQLLLTKRADNKKTFPSVWTNTVCGHPKPNESAVDAGKRRLFEELGLIVDDIKEIAPYRYQFADQNGIVENEICPILIAYSDAYPSVNQNEISEWKWIPWSIFLLEINDFSGKFSPWSREEAVIVDKYIKDNKTVGQFI